MKSFMDKFFIKFQFNLKKIQISLFKSLEFEEREILESNRILSDETEYKEFLTFILNNFCCDLNLKENLILEFNMKLFNFFLIDKDFIWKINNNGNIEEFPILNQEFSVKIILDFNF
jgi:hypothetical protein